MARDSSTPNPPSAEKLPQSFFDDQAINPSNRAAFEYFYEKTAKEGLNVEPEYNWDLFDQGVAPVLEDAPVEDTGLTPLELTDILAVGLIPNYTRDSTTRNELYPAVPVLDSLDENFILNMNKAIQTQAARVIGIHPTLASPLLYARVICSGFEKYLGIDIRERLFVTYGAYPTTMKYSIGKEREVMVSPVAIGRSIANLILTAPRSENTETGDSVVEDWMKATRLNFKLRNHDLMQKAGIIEIVIPSGRRGVPANSKVPPFRHKEFLPDGGIEYITDHDNPTFVMGVADSLLTNDDNPGSLVYVSGDPIPRAIKSAKQLREALVRSGQLVSTQNDEFFIEGSNDQRLRLGVSTTRRKLHLPSHEDTETY